MLKRNTIGLVVLLAATAFINSCGGGGGGGDGGGSLALPLIIDAFRLRGLQGPNDEYVQIYNGNASPHTVAAISGTGYAIAASDGVVRCTIPNGTVIPAHRHFLCVNNAAGGYSIGAYPAGSGTATGDATFTLDIPDNAGIALFNNNTGGASFTPLPHAATQRFLLLVGRDRRGYQSRWRTGRDRRPVLFPGTGLHRAVRVHRGPELQRE